MPNESSSSNDPRLDRVIADYLKQLEEGNPPSQEELVEANPDLADSLKAFFADHQRMRDLATRPDDSGLDDATIPPSASSDDDATLPPSGGGDEATIPPTRRDEAPPVGTRVRYFGDYELLEEIARGGMGVVYKARQTKLNRIVALKMILSGQLAGDEDVRRFHAEAEAAAQLDHPGIVPIFEVGEHEGQHYFSMAFVDGGSLADKIKDGPLPPREAAEYVRKVSEAVAYAHSKGVIHRDLKPGNILLDPNGEPKVTDFGLAKRVEGDSGLTATGQILGTPSYMPPEQASGKTDEVTEAADVYSLGAILYACLTGRPPFQAANPMDTLLQVLGREPAAPCTLNEAIPKDLETICQKCLQKNLKSRYSSAFELRDELKRFLNGEPIRARPISHLERGWRWCQRNKVVSIACATVLVSLIMGCIVAPTLLRGFDFQFTMWLMSISISAAVFIAILVGPESTQLRSSPHRTRQVIGKVAITAFFSSFFLPAGYGGEIFGTLSMGQVIGPLSSTNMGIRANLIALGYLLTPAGWIIVHSDVQDLTRQKLIFGALAAWLSAFAACYVIYKTGFTINRFLLNSTILNFGGIFWLGAASLLAVNWSVAALRRERSG